MFIGQEIVRHELVESRHSYPRSLILILEKLVRFDMMSSSNKNKPRMIAAATWREFLPVDAGDFALLRMVRIVENLVDARLLTNVSGLEFIANVSRHHSSFVPKRVQGTTFETSKKSCRRLGFSQLLNLHEKAEDFAVLRVNALTVFGYVTAEHFPVSFRDFHRCSFLGFDLLTARPLERSFLFAPLKEAAG